MFVHRNGEITPPEIEGEYDFFGKRDNRHLGAKNVPLTIIRQHGVLSVMEGIPWGLEFYEGRWWGPKNV